MRKGVSARDPQKQKQRTYKLYERDHSFSLVHLDWHDSNVFPDKHICAVEDDASRLILSGDEFDSEESKHNIKLMKQASKFAFDKYSAIIRV